MLVKALLAFVASVATAAQADGINSETAALARVESCQAELFAWSSSKESFESKHGHTSTSYFSSTMTIVSHEPETPTATSIVTLCDGFPRVVGQWTTASNISKTTYDYAWTNTNPTFVLAHYPTPQPCSISPEECKLLYSSYTSHVSELTRAHPDQTDGVVLDSPPCETSTPPQPSYSTNAQGKQCDNCLIAGQQIRLLYWPVTTYAGGNLCDDRASTFTGTATGPPRSIVTEGITITSPTVAVSIHGLSRVDDCGTTVQDTIIPVLPEDVSSVNGARALFTHYPFNFADLNYHCLDAPNEEFVTTGTRTDCYQEVPASAYFLGLANAAGVQWNRPGVFANRTIWPNYHPQVLPPQTITDAIRSLWGPDCYIHPDGIWDPPVALQQVASFPLPAEPGMPTSYYTPQTDIPQPGGPTTPNAPEPTQTVFTAEAQNEPSTAGPTQPMWTHSSWHGEGYPHGWDEVDEHGDNGDEGAAGNGGPEHTDDQAGATSHEVVVTTVLTYVSAAPADNDGQTAGHGEGVTQVHTTTRLSTALEGASEVIHTHVVTFIDGDQGTNETNDDNDDDDSHLYTMTLVTTEHEVQMQSAAPTASADVESDDQTSAASFSTSDATGASGQSPTSLIEDPVSSAIQSGIGGDEGGNGTPQQADNGGLQLANREISLLVFLFALLVLLV